MSSLPPPTTKQFREFLKNAFKEHGVVVEESRTRELSYHLAWRHFNIGNYRSYGSGKTPYRRMIYKIRCQFDEDKEAIKRALDDALVLMTLHGLDPKIKVFYRKWTPIADLEAIAVIS